ncbi:hypothetical protein [Shimia sp.]|uniref:hypothetical protein n=1 Tax=Shimia sp. TaxID=1954381 RepID=UPI003569CD77
MTGCALVALAACQPTIPDSAAGVGFDNAVLSPRPAPATTASALPPASAVSQEPLTSAEARRAPPPLATTAVAAPPRPAAQSPAQPPAQPPAQAAPQRTASAASADPSAPTSAAPGAPQTTADGIVHASPSNPAPELVNNPGISDENSFDAVGSRRSIADDAALIASNRATYEVIAPTALPERTSTGPNIVAYALSLTHPVGTKMYGRIGLTSKARHQKACAKYATPGDAQSAFLSRGGPKKDRLGLDPDGDGYACAWDPAPFRQAARN